MEPIFVYNPSTLVGGKLRQTGSKFLSMAISRAFSATGQTLRHIRAVLVILLVGSILVSARPVSPGNNAGNTESYALTLQTLHCPWFSVVDDLVSLVQMKNTTGNEMNVYLTIRFGSNIVEDGNYLGTDPITVGPYENKTINLRQIVTQHRKLFKTANTGGVELTYFGNPTDLIAKTSIVSMKHRQSFDIPFVNPILATSNILDCVQWYIGGDYRTFVELKNTTTEDLSVTLFIRHGKDAVTEETFEMPAQQSRAIDIREFKPVLDGDVTGSLELRHNGVPGAIVANSTIMSRSLGLSFDSPFIPRVIPKE